MKNRLLNELLAFGGMELNAAIPAARANTVGKDQQVLSGS
jgi:hypothetical protein